MEEDVGPVILMNKFSIDPEEFDQFLKGWATEAGKFKEQPGFISTQLHKGIGGSGTFINYVVWESVEHFKMPVQWHLLICSRKLQYLESVWNKEFVTGL